MVCHWPDDKFSQDCRSWERLGRLWKPTVAVALVMVSLCAGGGGMTAERGPCGINECSYGVLVKTINLSLPEETWRQARIEAAKHNTSLSGLVRRYLQAMVQGKAPVIAEESDAEADRRSREALLAALQEGDLHLGFRPSRDKTYER